MDTQTYDVTVSREPDGWRVTAYALDTNADPLDDWQSKQRVYDARGSLLDVLGNFAESLASQSTD